ncbi:hypothetical protein N6B72_15650 [Chryseobacterium soli]|uniref:6-phosphogluconate dehydrogenase n=1 Tax=Chryseobacterium soli TaxID=445961 RepID=A0A086A917_9FLAO|nr:hypothetical protein [Chryseobacterium soli]KFF13181.1 hypothetical protein IW15_10535 [Chryseobacterium soli]MDV7698360.1 hypothetical protein [Chryseobacterium soli]
MKKSWWIVLGTVILLIGVLVWYKFFFVFGEGVKSGYLNYAIKKGYVFKTYEGKIIQEGFGKGNTGTITSYEFEFSVSDPEVFKQLEANSGKSFDLHYKEYKGTLPWRGNTKYIVDKVVNMK